MINDRIETKQGKDKTGRDTHCAISIIRRDLQASPQLKPQGALPTAAATASAPPIQDADAVSLA